MNPRIKAIFGPEPLRGGEYPISFMVGFHGVTKITSEEQNFGTYGILWFKVWKGDAQTSLMNAAHVACVELFPSEGGEA